LSTISPFEAGFLYEYCRPWEKAFEEFESKIDGYAQFKGKLAESAQTLAACLKFDGELERLGERLGNYAFLKMAEDQTNGDYQKLMARLQSVATKAGEAGSYIRPEIMEIDDAQMEKFVATPEMELYQLMMERLTRYKPFTLSEKEEQLLAMQGEMAGATNRIFRQLHDADLKFGTLEDENGDEVELSPSTFSQFLVSPNREVRKKAFHQFYEQFTGHKNSLAAILAGSYYARARGYDSALHSALYADNVPQSVYDNLIGAVRKNLPALYKYYDLRKRKMGLDDIHHYDTYVPILSDIEIEHTWDQAVDVVAESLSPLGDEYVSVLKKGLAGRWCDRYPNAGKQSGAFSAGCFDSEPYILMNYKHQPFEYYSYTIFVAEVASTFNEQLLTRHMLEKATDDRLKAYLINNEIDSIRGTIIRQTMFAEFEKLTHDMCENGQPLTVDTFQEVYGQLLTDYFGPDFAIDEELWNV